MKMGSLVFVSILSSDSARNMFGRSGLGILVGIDEAHAPRRWTIVLTGEMQLSLWFDAIELSAEMRG